MNIGEQNLLPLTFIVAAYWEVRSEEEGEVDDEAFDQDSSKHTEEQHTQSPDDHWNRRLW